MTQAQFPSEFLEFLSQIKGKRPKTVIDHILEHGFITTQELKDLYGYHHPPRAARDVREQGVPLITFWVEGNDGRKTAAYKFGDPRRIQKGKLGGRKAIPKSIKVALLERENHQCVVCRAAYQDNLLQVDHRVPYEIRGEEITAQPAAEDYMLLCGSCNRAKSWSCEQCENWNALQSDEICQSCYWASPETYTHIAMRPIRRVDLVWTEAEIAEFDRLMEQADQSGETLPDYIKTILADYLRSHRKGEI
jgi:hypothetical protein